MKLCKKCNVKVDTPVTRCPLCYATLSALDGQPEPLCYPGLTHSVIRYNMIWRVLIFLTLSVNTICITVNYFTPYERWWSMIVLAATGYIWITIATAVRRNRKLGFAILVQGLSLSGMILVLDHFLETSSNWALNYAIPLLFLIATMAISIIIILKRVNMRDFILYFVLTALLGLIPILLILFRLVTIRWPSLVSIVYSALSLSSIFIFADHATKIELKKRFHI